jgi:3-dehydroquinate dehydratase II
MSSILLLNGPNLNLLGSREPELYGSTTLADVEAMCTRVCAVAGHTLEAFQSNHEGALIDQIHAAGKRFKSGELLGVVFNPGAYTHTSVALFDAIKGVAPMLLMEVHISNVHAREAFRHHSYVSPAAAGVVMGLGVDGYTVAVEALLRRAAKR